MAGELIARARGQLAGHDLAQGLATLGRVATETDDLTTWLAADRLLGQLWQRADGHDAPPGLRRTVRLALLSSHTSGQLAVALRVAALAHGIRLEVHETPYRAYEEQVHDPTSALYAFGPDVVALVIDRRDLHLPPISDDPVVDVAAEVSRWTRLWQVLQERTGARIVQTTFVPPTDDPYAGLAFASPGGRVAMIRRLGLELAAAAPDGVHLVDAETVAARVGEAQWHDPRYWYHSKHAVGLAALPTLATAILDVTASALGLGRKVVVLDLDNTLWGGVVGEDGVGGIQLGSGAAGEAYVDLQAWLKELTRRGMLLAVVSKNNPDDAREPFERHPDMRLTLDDIVAFEASWDDKPLAVQRVAAHLDLGLDALVFVDDNPVEREAVRQALPQVGVVELPAAPTEYLRTIARFPGLQAVALTHEDTRRTAQYRARAQAGAFAAQAGSREDFLAGLELAATIEPLDEVNAQRIVQLIGKTNQFNLTGRRHSAADVQRLAGVDRAVVWGMRVRDRFDDHGLVAALVAVPDGDDLVVDTFVMSCRVIGRTVEQSLLVALAEHARDAGFARLRGDFVPTAKNTPSRDVYRSSGFTRDERRADAADAGVRPDAADAAPRPQDPDAPQTWSLDLTRPLPQPPTYVAVALPALKEHR